jgi:hypothetical protein
MCKKIEAAQQEMQAASATERHRADVLAAELAARAPPDIVNKVDAIERALASHKQDIWDELSKKEALRQMEAERSDVRNEARGERQVVERRIAVLEQRLAERSKGEDAVAIKHRGFEERLMMMEQQLRNENQERSRESSRIWTAVTNVEGLAKAKAASPDPEWGLTRSPATLVDTLLQADQQRPVSPGSRISASIQPAPDLSWPRSPSVLLAQQQDSLGTSSLFSDPRAARGWTPSSPTSTSIPGAYDRPSRARSPISPVAQPGEISNRLFDQLDRNRDGVISRSEFASGFQGPMFV